MRAVVLVVVLAGCHLVERNEIVRPGAIERVPLRDRPTARPATLQLTEGGQFRFVEPLECPTENVIQQTTGLEILTKPNLATFVVGIVATSLGAVATIRGVSDDDPGGSPFLYAGAALIGGGLPLAVGPWIGNRTETTEGAPRPAVRSPGSTEPCGERTVVAKTATLRARGLEIYGSIDGDGMFSISPFAIIDAYETAGSLPTWEISAVIDGDRSKQVAAMIDGGAFATRSKGFLAAATFDARVEPMRLVPGLSAGALRVGMVASAGGTAVRIVLPIKNDGPGPAWGVRGHLTAPSAPSIDGRILYIGSIAKGEGREGELVIPISPEVAGEIRNSVIGVSLELRDAHGTAPATPIRFRGPVIVDPTR